VRVFIDACIDPRVAEFFQDHIVSTAYDLDWDTLPDNEIVRRCIGRFNVVRTADQGFEFEHNLRKLTFGIVIVHVPRNTVENYRELRGNLLAAVVDARPGLVIHVG
jgi:predicted nuclease of predicted toxin-antitoxin system